jgi:hypothetical protein
MVIRPSRDRTRILLSRGDYELLRAVLPPPTTAHPKAAETLLEGLSLWLQQPLDVALAADAGGYSSALGLCDGFGFGRRTVHYAVEVVEPGRRRGLGSFRDLRQMAFRGIG